MADDKNKGNKNAAAIVADANAPAAAPVVAPAPEQVIAAQVEQAHAEKDNGNPYNRIFESATFRLSDSDRVFDGKDGSKSKALASVTLVMAGGFAATTGTIYGRKPANNGAPYVEFTFLSNQARQSAIQPLDEASRAHLNDFRRSIAEQFSKWYAGQAKASGPTKSTAVAVEGLNF